MAEDTATNERIEKMVSEMMRSARDEKVRLEAQVKELTNQVNDLQFRLDKTTEKHDALLARATQFETDLRSMSSIIHDSLARAGNAERGQDGGVQNKRPLLASDRRPQVLDRQVETQESAILDTPRPRAKTYDDTGKPT